jgi:hypothetical protein
MPRLDPQNVKLTICLHPRGEKPDTPAQSFPRNSLAPGFRLVFLYMMAAGVIIEGEGASSGRRIPGVLGFSQERRLKRRGDPQDLVDVRKLRRTKAREVGAKRAPGVWRFPPEEKAPTDFLGLGSLERLASHDPTLRYLLQLTLLGVLVYIFF